MPRIETRYNWSLFVNQLRSEPFLCVTQEILARKLRLSVYSVSKWERGQAIPSMKWRVKLQNIANSVGYTEKDWPLAATHRTGPRRLSGEKTD